MKTNKFFELAKEKGIESSEVTSRKSKKLEVSLFNGEVEHFTIADSTSIRARGIVNGKFASAFTNKDDKLTPTFLVNEILDDAKIIEKDDPAILFEGSPKYKKFKPFNNELEELPAEKKIEKLKALSAKAKTLDARISDIEVEYSETSGEKTLQNSKGLKLKSKSNYFFVYISIVARAGEETKQNYSFVIDNDFSKINIDELAAKAVKETVSKFNSTQCASKNYPVVLSPAVVSVLVDATISSASAEEIQKKSSVLEGKVGQKIASSRVTISDRPVDKSIFFTSFDDEGVACKNKDIIKNGVLKTYLYNLETAAKDGVETTGNGAAMGSKIGISAFRLVVKPGKQTFEGLCEKAGEGVYITEVEGIGTGLNPQSGDFSLQANGFYIRDGKLAESLNLITVSGNLFKLLQDVKEVGKDSEETTQMIYTPAMLVKKLAIGGK